MIKVRAEGWTEESFSTEEEAQKCVNALKAGGYKKVEIQRPCDKPPEVYSRVCGFYRPVQQWNKGKKAEFEDRVEYQNPTKGVFNV